MLQAVAMRVAHPPSESRERIRRTTGAEEIAIAAANIEGDGDALKRVSREIFKGIERLGAVKVKEYVIPRTARATIQIRSLCVLYKTFLIMKLK